MSETKTSLPEPWLRGTLSGIPVVPRAVLHALELAQEDLWKWCYGLSEEQLNDASEGIAPVAFHLRHIARSLDRLLTYAEGGALNQQQLAQLKTELHPGARRDEIFAELQQALGQSQERLRRLATADLETPRAVGKKHLPTTIGGLLVHVAEHTQRHVGQAIIRAKLAVRR